MTIASFRYLSKISIVLIILFLVIYLPFGENLIQAITSDHDPVLLNLGWDLIFVSVVYGLLKIPLSLALAAFAGHDLVSVEKKYNSIQQILKITSLVVCVLLKLGVIWYLLMFSTLSILLLLIANFHYFKSYFNPSFKRLYQKSKKISFGYITSRSFKFFVFTLSSIVVWSTDSLLVSMFYGSAMTANYQINFSIFNAAFLFITAIAGALVANYGNHLRENDFEGLSSKLNISLYVALLTALFIAVGGVFFSEDIIRIWVGEGHYLGFRLVLAFAIFGVTLSFSSILNVILSLFADAKVIMSIAVAELILNISLSLLMLKSMGLYGVAVATSIASLVAVIIPALIISKSHFGNKIKFDIKPLLYQILLSVLVISILGFEVGEFSLLGKVILFLVYAFLVFLLTFFIKKDFFKFLMRFSFRLKQI
jgi:O-antigen/teichoic acid export membrane protein